MYKKFFAFALALTLAVTPAFSSYAKGNTAQEDAEDESSNGIYIEAVDEESLPVSDEAETETEKKVYTEDDWDKWRVQYNRINNRPYEETEREEKIYSYVQVPPQDTGKKKWAGDWYAIEMGGKPFAHFGCGTCCVSNIYSTFIQRPVDPGKMLGVATRYTSYDPVNKAGAISWDDMRKLCIKLGMSATLHEKDAAYGDFQKTVGKSSATVVLVCKDNDPGLWFYTNGHYVTLWEYDPEDDSVFVTDSSGLFNRDRVFLRDVYDALKTASRYQYMCVQPEGMEYLISKK